MKYSLSSSATASNSLLAHLPSHQPKSLLFKPYNAHFRSADIPGPLVAIRAIALADGRLGGGRSLELKLESDDSASVDRIQPLGTNPSSPRATTPARDQTHGIRIDINASMHQLLITELATQNFSDVGFG